MPLRIMLPIALESWLVTAEPKFYRALSKGLLSAHLLWVDDIPKRLFMLANVKHQPENLSNTTQRFSDGLLNRSPWSQNLFSLEREK